MSLSPLKIWRQLTPIDRILFGISFVCGVGYLVTPYFFRGAMRPFWPLNTCIKTLAVSTLAILMARQLNGRARIIFPVALAFSSLGDLFLSLRNGNYFVAGLSAFLVAHLFFITVWLQHWARPLRPTFKQISVVLAILTFSLIMLWWMLPLPGLSVPVAAYMCVLTTMVICATLAQFKTPWIMIGACLFLLSDTLIGLNTFKHLLSGKLASFLIWSTYYSAQYLMTFGFLGEKKWREQ